METSLKLLKAGESYIFVLKGEDYTQTGDFYKTIRYQVIDMVTHERLPYHGQQWFHTLEDAIYRAASLRGVQTRLAVVPIEMYVCDKIEHDDKE